MSGYSALLWVQTFRFEKYLQCEERFFPWFVWLASSISHGKLYGRSEAAVLEPQGPLKFLSHTLPWILLVTTKLKTYSTESWKIWFQQQSEINNLEKNDLSVHTANFSKEREPWRRLRSGHQTSAQWRQKTEDTDAEPWNSDDQMCGVAGLRGGYLNSWLALPPTTCLFLINFNHTSTSSSFKVSSAILWPSEKPKWVSWNCLAGQ